jgi:hypothetical protein
MLQQCLPRGRGSDDDDDDDDDATRTMAAAAMTTTTLCVQLLRASPLPLPPPPRFCVTVSACLRGGTTVPPTMTKTTAMVTEATAVGAKRAFAAADGGVDGGGKRVRVS